MKDRVVQYPARYQLVLVAGTTDTYDLVAVPGTVSEAGTPLNRENLIGVASLATHRLIQTYATAGSYTWTASDPYEDGQPYDIYAVVDSGGGSGAASARKDSGSQIVASGGASGCRKIVKATVTPGNTYAVVVGAGGAAVSVTAGPALAVGVGANGNAGGSSSFNGVSALGGTGGKWSKSAADTAASLFAGNGVMPDSAYCIHQNYSTVGVRQAPSRGAAFLVQTSDAGVISVPNPIIPFELANPFDPSEGLFSAGGGAAAYSGVSVKDQTVETLSDGFSAGAGYAEVLSAIAANLTRTGNSATSHSSGGGGMAFGVITSDTTYTVTAVSGAGADGQVRIYARRAS